MFGIYIQVAIYDIFKIYIIVLGCVLGGVEKEKEKISMGVGEGMGTWLLGGMDSSC